MKKVLIKLISYSLRILSEKKSIIFQHNINLPTEFKSLSKDLLKNSSLFYKTLYFLNSLAITIINLFPSSFSNSLFKIFLNPRINPISKVYLFLIYHHGYK
tara:strand:- start:281 stop:583 length:303 start_codon:yes stop_codon:yes gene_type:complete